MTGRGTELLGGVLLTQNQSTGPASRSGGIQFGFTRTLDKTCAGSAHGHSAGRKRKLQKLEAGLAQFKAGFKGKYGAQSSGTQEDGRTKREHPESQRGKAHQRLIYESRRAHQNAVLMPKA
jgi:hypothetical protein